MHPQDDSETEYSQDGFLGEKLRVRQPLDGFRSGHDAVLLAAASAPPQGGHIVELGDADQLANTIDNLLTNPDKVRQLSISARKRAEEEFSSKALAKNTETIYRAIVTP